MKANQQKIFKFARKEYQASEEVNPKREQNQKEEERSLGQQQKSKLLPIEEQKLRRNINYFAEEKPADQQPPIESVQQNKQKQAIYQGSFEGKPERRSETKIQFDQRLIKVAMPDQLEKIKYVRKIESRLLACLQKKKPHISVKQLINQPALNEILGKKQRKLINRTGSNEQKLNTQPSSATKQHPIKKEIKQKNQANKKKKKSLQVDWQDPVNLNDVNSQFQSNNQGSFETDLQINGRKQASFNLNFPYSKDIFANGPSFFGQQANQLSYSSHIPNNWPQNNRKPSAQQEKQREKQRSPHTFDLRNLRIPRLDRERTNEQRKPLSIETIEEAAEYESLDSYFSSEHSRKNDYFWQNSYQKRTNNEGLNISFKTDWQSQQDQF